MINGSGMGKFAAGIALGAAIVAVIFVAMDWTSLKSHLCQGIESASVNAQTRGVDWNAVAKAVDQKAAKDQRAPH